MKCFDRYGELKAIEDITEYDFNETLELAGIQEFMGRHIQIKRSAEMPIGG